MRGRRIWGPLFTVMLLLGPGARPARAAPRADRDSVRALLSASRYAEAESLARVRLIESERRWGPTSRQAGEYAESLALARHEQDFNDSLTLALARRGAAIRELRTGASVETAEGLLFYGKLLTYATRFAEADSVLARSLSLRLAIVRVDDPSLATTWNEIGRLRTQQGRLAEADSALTRAMVLVGVAASADSDAVLDMPVQLAKVKTREGRYEEARPILERVLAQAESRYGAVSPDVSAVADQLASTLQHMGRYAEARPLFERALAIDRQLYGDGTRAVAIAHNNLGVLLHEMRFPDEALVELREALRINTRLLGEDHLSVAFNWNTIGAALQNLDSLDAAVDAYQRSLAIKRRKLDPTHPSVLLTLSSLASANLARGHSDEALAGFREALAGRELKLPPDHPDVAVAHRLVGTALLYMNRPREALPELRMGWASLASKLGDDHLLTMGAQLEVAGALAMLGERDSALQIALACEESARRQARDTYRALSESEATRYAGQLGAGLMVAAGLARPPGGLDAPDRARVHDALIRSRSLALDELASRRRSSATPAAPGSALAAAREAHHAALERLAHGLVSSAAGSSAVRDSITRARAAVAAAERNLAAIDAREVRRDLGLEDVRRVLPAGSCLVSYVRWPMPRWLVPGSRRNGPEEEFAFVLRSGEPEPELVALGRAGPIDSLVVAFRRQVGLPPRAGRGREDERDARETGEALRRAIWDPVAARLGVAKDVYVVPEGSLALLPFACLPEPRGRYLVEGSRTLHLLEAEADLVPDATSAGRTPVMVAFGDPDFDGRTTTSPEMLTAAFRGERPTCADFASVRWRPLPGTREEAEDAAATWARGVGAGGRVLSRFGADASEGALRELVPGARVVHIATHGFFVNGHCASADSGTRGVGGVVRDRPAPPLAPAPLDAASLRLSGLVLAGANRRDASSDAADDGILTAEEVATLDLSAAEWVVLSACESGVADIEGAAGVAGLRRAFRVAGVRTLVLSLWPVSDSATRPWMRALYEARFGRGESPASAVRDASRTLLEGRRARREDTHPFYWAAFVATSGRD